MTIARRLLLLLTLAVASVVGLRAQELTIKPQYVVDTFTDISESGDTSYHVVLKTITVFPEWKFKNKKEEEFYWRTVRDVKKALPYAKMICRTLTETYEYIETLPDTKTREKHLKDMESAVFDQYKPAMKKFTKKQANLLVKLIMRETNQTGYDILKAFLGNFRAAFWQGFGKLFGVSLKGKFEPDKNREDAIIERVCIAVEQGTI
ncbi:MAG: DUF4294 domain-containing protein [Bacteroides sp.]|nr:DUF4294 domain-containing protein [Bacteroides sp.]MBD5415118.1 DUF4294 domain-containing protein [Bacteroides sp.]MDE6222475.1 DUF4294 domain-containing protein [Muribaculaceae bacterium]